MSFFAEVGVMRILIADDSERCSSWCVWNFVR